ncbi:MAG: peptidoglycan DD-metalloendopeptidase family protein [Eubacteriales bacterium SKADARSKE-1]|nr:peptidoglycan DD-metalloendopeptidase family protein [Eubacteriales bacterium SKADARSKE-1]
MRKYRALSRCVAFLLLFTLTSMQATVNVSAKSSISSLSKKQTELNRTLKNIKNGIGQKQVYKNVVNNNIKSLQSQIDTEARKLDDLNNYIEQKESVIAETQNAIESQRDELAKRMCAIYKTCDTSTLEILIGAKDFGDLLDKADLIQKMSQQDSNIINSLNENIKNIENEKASVEKSKTEAETFKSSLGEKKTKLEHIEKENDSAISGLKQQEVSTQSKLNQILLEKQKLEEQISLFHAQYSKSEAHSGNYSKGKYSWPVNGFSHISSPFGGRRNHKGIDISGPGIYGAPILAAADGVVIKSNSTNSWGSGWGYHVMISHGNGYATQYAHCSSINVSVGQNIKAGQVIGRVGNTGHSFGAHLHFETWKDGKRYNPSTEL